MTLHTGTGTRPGVALAAAARLRVEYGVASFGPERLRRLATRLRAFGAEDTEPEQVVLVADTLPLGFMGATAGLQIVGLAIGSDAPLVPPPDCPAVIGLGPDFFESVLEDEIVIVDGSRGQVHVSPDAVTLARCQSPAVRARRIFLDDVHLPARTASESRAVAVFAPAQTAEDVFQAMRAGADGVFFFGEDGFPLTASGQERALAEMMETLGGLPLLLQMPPECLALTALAHASALGPLHLVVESTKARNELATRLVEIEALMEDEDQPFGTPQFELSLSTTDDSPLPDGLDGFAGVVVAEAMGEADMGCLLSIAALAHRTRRPLMLSLSSPADLPHALTLGGTRLLVSHTDTNEIKDAIREW